MKPLSIFLVTLLFFACEPEQTQAEKEQAQIEALQTEVIKIHDEVMPKNADINRVGRKLKAILKDTTLTAEKVKLINDHVFQLTKADLAMSDWMVGFKTPSKKDPFESTMKYLNQEKVKISEVRDLMNNSLAKGKSLLTELEKK